MNRPVAEIPALRTKKEAPAALPEAERARVLLVDDDERNLLAVATVLEDLGEVVLARSGEEALRHLLKGEFAVILLDVYMPGMDGYEAAQIIRSRDQSKGIPIVFLSAVNKEAEHLLRGYAMGAVDYVFKPVDPIILRSKVAVFVDLFDKTREIERKARHEQALLDANLRANADRLRAEQELRRAEQRQAAIIQSLPMVLYLEPVDAHPRSPTFVSGDFEAITGFRYDQVEQNPSLWADRLHPDDRDRTLAAIEARRKSGRSSIEYRWLCAGGDYKHFLDQAVLLQDGDGRAVEFAGTLTDISEQRSLENQLVHAQKMDAIGKLTGGIAHDFNNLLAAVIGGLSMIERRADLADESKRILGMTKRAAEQGSELVRRLLAFARRQKLEPRAIDFAILQDAVADLLAAVIGGLSMIERRADLADESKRILGMTKRAAEQGSELVRRLLAFARRQKLEPRAIDFAILQDAVADLLAHTMGGLVNIQWQVDEDLWHAFADQAQLELALINLIINARDAMPAGGTVTISAQNREASADDPPGVTGDYVRIVVHDTGTGIAPEVIEKVMEPFFTTKDVGKGSGLGLSMVYGFAKQSNGAFAIESELGKGTTAALWLPRAPASAPLSAEPPVERKHARKVSKLKVLLVDDHPEVRITTAAVLEDSGHEVFQAANGTEALKLLEERNCDCDLLISDYAMPHLSGTEFLRAARELCPDVPALIITGYAEIDAISDRPDGVEVLLKPFTPSALEAAIERICSAHIAAA